MSVDINWETLTSGDDGKALAETIKDFVHERFQQIPLPKLLRSVQVHAFEFGTVAPEIVLKDVCNPLSDFYDNDGDDTSVSEGRDDTGEQVPNLRLRTKEDALHRAAVLDQPITPGLSGGAALGTGSNLGYFNFAGFSTNGTATPLAAVAGAQFSNNNGTQPPYQPRPPREAASPSSAPSSRPISRDCSNLSTFPGQHASALDGGTQEDTRTPRPSIFPNPEDLQIVFHVTYTGDIKLSLTAEVFLDYPMPSFVGIPLRLTITGMTFNGVGILAYIKKRAHLCFLSPDDAEALVGSESAAMSSDGDGVDGSGTTTTAGGRVGGLLEEIRIETEMGEAGEGGGQTLKNVGKIEKFVLEQVRRIFEDEFVYPSFWTFLV